MNEEEKKAIEWFREDLAEEKENCGKYNDYKKQVIKRNEKLLNLISKLQKENEKQSDVIDEMAGSLYVADAFSEYGNSTEEIKQYFYRKVEEDVKN